MFRDDQLMSRLFARSSAMSTDAGKSDAGADIDFLAIVLDLAADNWRSVVSSDATLMSQCIDAALALANAHVASSASNRILLTGCDQRLWLVFLVLLKSLGSDSSWYHIRFLAAFCILSPHGLPIQSSFQRTGSTKFLRP